MRQVFLDTSGLIATLLPTERYLQEAKQILESLEETKVPLITHEGVEIELLDSLSSLALRPFASRIHDTLARARNDNQLAVVELSRELVDQATRLFFRRPDKEWGLTDCISFVLMTSVGIHEAFTLDHHFVQAGFQRIIPVD